MKKFIFMLIICTFACSVAYAAAPRENCGCGLGSIVWENNDGLLSQTCAATTNGLFGNQTFGISSGTLDCEQPEKLYARKQLQKFIAANMDNIAKDIAMGTGESLDTLAELMQVSPENRGTFNTLLQKNFGRIFTSENVTDTEVLDNIADVTGLI